MSSTVNNLLEKLPYPQFQQLISVLSKDDKWRKIVEFPQLFSTYEISALSNSPRPSEKLLNEFITKLWTMDSLKYIFRECGLYEALNIISEPEPMQIIAQPTEILNNKNKLQVPLGDSFEIEFKVTGVPYPKFQWFRNNEALSNETKAILSYENFDPEMIGSFHCMATQNQDQIASNAIEIDMLPISCSLIEEPEKIVYLCEGSSLCLSLKVLAYPEQTYQWLYENNILEKEATNSLLIKNVTKSTSGDYRCYISNQISELVVKITVVVYSENKIEIYKGPISYKVALLIANENYDHTTTLMNPSNDVNSLARALQTLGFQTLCLLNLNLKEIELAIELFSDCVDDRTFVFFYYAGHGFEMGDRFLLPVDAPNCENFKKIHAVSESFILNRVLNKTPIIFILLLDMCLKMPNKLENPSIHEEVLIPHTFKSNRNLIRGYSTTSHLSSYEVDGNSNGIYMGILEKYLKDDDSILTILSKVNSEISSTCPDQMPCISYITSQDFYLNIKTDSESENEFFHIFTIQNERINLNGVTIGLQQYKEVFNNFLEIVISNVSNFQYKLPTNCEFDSTEIDNNTVLQIRNLQRMENHEFVIWLQVENIEFTIKKDLQIVLLFNC